MRDDLRLFCRHEYKTQGGKLLMNVQFIVGCKQKRPLTSSRLVVIWSSHGMKNALLCTVQVTIDLFGPFGLDFLLSTNFY